VGHAALILGDQLSHANPALEGADRVLMIESRAALARLRYHRRRRHLVLSAMRHFAAELRGRGVEVDYVVSDDKRSVIARHGEVVAAQPNDGPARRSLARAGVRFVPSTQFLTDVGAFTEWAEHRPKRLVMEDFYRDQRRRLGLLMDGDKPAGGRWNLDRENREPPKEGMDPPLPWMPEEDDIDAAVRRDLDAYDLPEFGEDGPREWPATAAEARRALDDFIAHRLPDFGTYQDAMVPGERWMFHSRLSAAFNLWLLDPLEAARAAEDAYRRGDAPLNAAEGFVRQVIGWREYIWCMYWLREREWRTDNALDATTPLAEVFWTGETDLNCLRNAMLDVRESAYAHHILRLMVLGNLHLLLGTRPWEAVEWFRSAFIDGAEWVMAPNVAGMATFADGGVMMTKPYAAAGRYVHRMSHYCRDCRFVPERRTGEDACPVTQLFWDFMARNEERLAGNRRLRGQMASLRRMDPEELAEVRAAADRVRASLVAGRPTAEPPPPSP
jgi:deoxyribodipyrimidine photolyase-related protein